MANSYIFSSESVTEGHPRQGVRHHFRCRRRRVLLAGPQVRVACETLVKDNIVVLGGEITTSAKFDYREVVKAAITEIGYTNNDDCKFNAANFFFINALGQQSPDIAQGVDAAAADGKETAEQGAGDQGIMFGYAVNETPSLMPAPILYSHQLGRAITDLRRAANTPGSAPTPRPRSPWSTSMASHPRHRRRRLDPARRQHHHPEIREILKKELIQAVIPGELLTDKTEYHINPTGLFIIGGPEGDCGLTGRKIIVDTYGGMGRHGGGAFSGKDPSKVDRSAAYMCRYVAKNASAAGLADRCELQLAYAIGYPQPVSVHVDTFGTNHVDNAKIERRSRRFSPSNPPISSAN